MLLVLLLAVSPAAVIGGHQQTLVPSFTGCLDPGGDLTDLAPGDAPKTACKGNRVEVHLSGGDITAVLAGDGLTGGAGAGAASLAVNTRTIQSRVTGTCDEGSSIREVAQDGTVVCELDDVGTAHNPLQVALLRWYEARAALTFDVRDQPRGVAFDGQNIWVANSATGPTGETVTVRRASDGVSVRQWPASPGATALAFDGQAMWVTNAVTDTVTAYLLEFGPAFSVAVGDSPQAIAFDGANMWVANTLDDTVSKIDARFGKVVGTFAVGSAPSGLAFDGTHIWVANTGDFTITKLRADDGSVQGTFPTGATPLGVAFDGANIWVANQTDDTVTKLRADDGAVVGTFKVRPGPTGLAFDGTHIWVACQFDDVVAKLRADDGSLLGIYATGGERPYGVAFDGANVWVTNYDSDTVAKL